jgi:hypothetical protein
MRAFAAFVAAFALPGCAAAPSPEPGPGPAADGNDCAVIAAIAKEHYRFNTTDTLAPPLWLDAEGSDWTPRCDWSRHGVSFPGVYDPERTREPAQRVQWVSFKRPRYDGQGAIVETGILHGPLAGMGYECRLRSGFAGWTVSECRNTWIS